MRLARATKAEAAVRGGRSDGTTEGRPVGSWSGSTDYQYLVGAANSGEPGALVRGGTGAWAGREPPDDGRSLDLGIRRPIE